MKSIAEKCMPGKWSQIYHATSRRCVNRANKELASLCGSLIFMGVLVRVSFRANMCIVSDQISEAGNVKDCSKLRARNGLRFIIRLKEDS